MALEQGKTIAIRLIGKKGVSQEANIVASLLG
jgi:hypothetical protein